ncbi:MAG: galactose mutarotase [Lentisphaerae bacterium]|jgi:aldose 1-epimerase|nr:galactose mutarotase [Lentisphaerota bacterium]
MFRRLMPLCLSALLLVCGIAIGDSVRVESRDYFTGRAGQVVKLFSLRSDNGFQVDVTEMGATIVSILTPDRDGKLVDVNLGYEKAESYDPNGAGFGAVVGRYANRITGGKFSLDGREFNLILNEKARNNTLHGGKSYGNRMWKGEIVDGKQVKLSLFSPDGDSGFPGNLNVEVFYSITDNYELVIKYRATTDAPTVVNLTNHAYFNLNGATLDEPCNDHVVWSTAKSYTEVDWNLSATGRILPVAGTEFDLSKGRRFEDIFSDWRLPMGFDHNFVVSERQGEFKRGVFRVVSTRTGITMDVDTDQPGVQFYMGYWLGNIAGKGGVKHPRFGGFCLETQLWPDSPNKATFPSARLDPGQVYTQHTVYRFGRQ